MPSGQRGQIPSLKGGRKEKQLRTINNNGPSHPDGRNGPRRFSGPLTYPQPPRRTRHHRGEQHDTDDFETHDLDTFDKNPVTQHHAAPRHAADEHGNGNRGGRAPGLLRLRQRCTREAARRGRLHLGIGDQPERGRCADVCQNHAGLYDGGGEGVFDAARLRVIRAQGFARRRRQEIQVHLRVR